MANRTPAGIAHGYVLVLLCGAPARGKTTTAVGLCEVASGQLEGFETHHICFDELEAVGRAGASAARFDVEVWSAACRVAFDRTAELLQTYPGGAARLVVVYDNIHLHSMRSLNLCWSRLPHPQQTQQPPKVHRPYDPLRNPMLPTRSATRGADSPTQPDAVPLEVAATRMQPLHMCLDPRDILIRDLHREVGLPTGVSGKQHLERNIELQQHEGHTRTYREPR
jgi:hypothetical protein